MIRRMLVGHQGVWLATLGLVGLSLLLPSTILAKQGNENKQGLDILIRAQNRSVNDTPFCGVGGGSVGDRLDVNVRTDAMGGAFGTASFEAADGTVTTLNIDEVFTFYGGLGLIDTSTRNTVAIWFGANVEEGGSTTAPAHVNVELNRGCGNTVSTFTVDADKVTMQIKFQ